MGYKATNAFTNMVLAIIDQSPPLEGISLGNFSNDAEEGNKILNALCSNETIHRSLERLSIGGNPDWWLKDQAKEN